MRRKQFLMTAVSLLLILCLVPVQAFAAVPRARKVITYPIETGNTVTDSNSTTIPQDQMLTVISSSTGKTVTDSVYNILCMVVEAEVGSGFHEEAIKAQAVATHSYLLYHANRGKIVTCPLKTPESRVKQCVAQVVDEVMTYEGKIIQAVYSASAGGATQSATDYWGGKADYLQPVDSPYDLENEIHSRTLDREYVRSWFPESTFPEDPNLWFEVVETNSTGFALKVRAGDKILSGYDFTSYDHIWMKSNKIIGITYNEADDTFTFTVAGRGHGVGLSQIGANGYAKIEGRDYIWILNHYFTGIVIQRVGEVM